MLARQLAFESVCGCSGRSSGFEERVIKGRRDGRVGSESVYSRSV